MADLTKLTNREGPVGVLRSLAAQVRTPGDYFAGRRGGDEPMPDDVVMFCRRSGRRLGGLPRVHHRFVLIVPLSGEATVYVDDLGHRLAPGAGLLVFPFQFHSYADAAARGLSWLFITFTLPGESGLDALHQRPLRLSEAAARELALALREYLALQHGRPGREGVLRRRLALLLTELVDAASATQGRRQRVGRPMARPGRESLMLLERVGRIVFDRMREPVPLAEVAEALGLAQSTLRQRFRREHGLSVAHYVRQLKMLQAMRLLRSGRLPVEAVAAACGYASLFSFSRSFKRFAGLPPSAYRRQRH